MAKTLAQIAGDSSWWDEGSQAWFNPTPRDGVNYGYLGPENCTWWVCGRVHDKTGSWKIGYNMGNSSNWYDRYSGDKTSGSTGTYVGDSINKGDVLVYTGGSSGYGHAEYVESVSGDTITISTSPTGTSTYASIDDTLSKSNMTIGSACGHYSNCYLKGVLHTGESGGGDTPVVPDFVSYNILTNLNTPSLTGNLTATVSPASGRTYYCYWGTTAAAAKTTSFTPTISSGKFSWNMGNALEALMPNETQKTFYIYIYTKDSDGYSREYQTVSFTVKVPESYHPDIEYKNIRYTNTYKNYPIAGYSKASVDYDVKSVAPSGYTNTATIAESAFTANYLTLDTTTFSSSGTLSGKTLRSSKGYDLVFTGSAKDSRGVLIENIDSPNYFVYGYFYPQVTVKKLFKCDENGEVSSQGQYYRLTFVIDLSDEDLGNTISKSDIIVNLNGIQYTDVIEDDSEGNLTCLVGGDLDPTADYPLTLTLHDDIMTVFEIPDLTTAALSVTKLPFSLLDNQYNNVGAAFGKVAEEENCVEFASFMSVKATDLSTGAVKVRTAYQMLSGSEEEVTELAKQVGVLENRVTDIKENVLSNLKYKALTTEEYAELEEQGKIDENTIYFVYEA